MECALLLQTSLLSSRIFSLTCPWSSSPPLHPPRHILNTDNVSSSLCLVSSSRHLPQAPWTPSSRVCPTLALSHHSHSLYKATRGVLLKPNSASAFLRCQTVSFPSARPRPRRPCPRPPQNPPSADLSPAASCDTAVPARPYTQQRGAVL